MHRINASHRPLAQPFRAALMGFLLLMVSLAQEAGASLIAVNSSGDVDFDLPQAQLKVYLTDGKCTFREAVENAFKDSNSTNQGASADCAAGSGIDEITFTISPADVIKIMKPDYPVNLTSNLTIRGPATFDGNNWSRLFEIGGDDYINFIKIVMLHGSESDGGGGGTVLINSSAAKVFFDEVEIWASRAKGIGGAVATGGATVSFLTSRFFNNTSEATGGDIAGGGDIWIMRGYHRGARAEGGGSIHCTSGTLGLHYTVFLENTAYGSTTPQGDIRGGGAVMSGCNINASNVKAFKNSVGGNVGGGAFYITAGASSSLIEDSEISFNDSGLYLAGYGPGGGILAEGSLVLNRSSVFSNTVQASKTGGICGGGLHFGSGSKSKVINSTVTSNYVWSFEDIAPFFGDGPSGDGAGVCAGQNADVELINATIKDNSGASELFVEDSMDASMTLKNTIVDGGGKHLNCDTLYNLPVILDGEYAGQKDGHNLQFDDKALTETGEPSCPFVVAVKDTELTDDPQYLKKIPPLDMLIYATFRPAGTSPAVGTGDPDVCAIDAQGQDMLKKSRQICCIGAREEFGPPSPGG